MIAHKRLHALAIALAVAFSCCCLCAYGRAQESSSAANNITWDDTNRHHWPEDFKRVKIASTVEESNQLAYFHKAGSVDERPLLVSLHTWSGEYSHKDPLAPMAIEAGWNYIHPVFQGPNKTTDACLSNKVIADIDPA